MANSNRRPPTDSELLLRSRAGDHCAFHELVDRYHGRLYATVLGMLGPAPEVEEVVQDTFIRFFRSLDRFEARSSLGTYLTRIAMNEAVKAMHRKQRWLSRFFTQSSSLSLQPETNHPSVPDSLESKERIEAIRRAVQSLKPPFRDVVVLRFLNGYSTDECAQILDIPSGTVMSRLTRALDKLAPLLKGVKES